MSKKKPSCFGECLGGNVQAERDCYRCEHLRDCAMATVPVEAESAASEQHDGGSEKSAHPCTAADILVEMADTYRERNAVYGSNYKMVGKLMAVLFPDGVPPEILHSDQFHLFELKLVKLSRFAISGLKHQDSIHDDGVYSAMIEAIILEQQK